MSDLGNVCMAAIVCYTLRSIFFRWAEHVEVCAKQKRTTEPDVLRRLERER